MQRQQLVLRAEHITLDALLKASGLVHSGGAAKTAVAAGQVLVDGEVETRRGRKLRAGQVVALAGAEVQVEVVAAPSG